MQQGKGRLFTHWRSGFIFEKLVNYTFHTTLVKVRVPENKPNHGVIFTPGPLGKMEGDFSWIPQ